LKVGDKVLELNKIYNMDCLEGMKLLPDNSVDMILCDLPYEETGNKWDKGLNLSEVFKEYERIIKEDGAIVLTGTFRFGVQLYNIAPHLYKYDWVWEKDNGTNAPNVNLQPFRIHENIFVFGKGRVTNGKRTPMKYNPQKTEGKPYKQTSGKMSDNWKGGLGTVVTDNKDGKRHPKTIQKFIRDKGLHPTQKPVEMFEYFIKTYTNEKDLVLDNCMGSGTTAIACINTNRNFIGFELDKQYFDIAQKRIADKIAQIIG
jgi:site-specific DNA-methyltransferase (adenine-specific)